MKLWRRFKFSRLPAMLYAGEIIGKSQNQGKDIKPSV